MLKMVATNCLSLLSKRQIFQIFPFYYPLYVCLFSREVKVRCIYSYLLYLFSLFPIGYPEAANEGVL